MVWLLIGVGVLAMLLLYGRAFVNADPKQVARIVTGVGGALAIALGALLTARGSIVFGAPLILFGLGALFPGLRLGGWGGGPSAGGVSEVETDWVRMSLDRDTGAMDGEVKRGRLAGRRLSELAEADLRAVLAEAAGQDRDAAALLHAYIERRFGRAAGGGGGGRSAGAPPQDAMSEEEALAVLGLERGASAQDVRAAHKRLMVKLHPDQGGSSWLAAKLNAARDRLIGKG